MLTPNVVRSSPRWKRVRQIVLRTAEVCAICGRRLVSDAPPRSRWSSSVDHVVPLSRGGAPFDVGNLRATHYGCNASRGDGSGRRRPSRPAVRRAAWW